MNKPHKHAELIKAWADGAEIEHKSTKYGWVKVDVPMWSPEHEYRIKPHKWQHLIDAQNAGRQVQARYPRGKWGDGKWDFASQVLEYRLKPETVKFRSYMCKTSGGFRVHIVTHESNEKTPRDKRPGFVQWVGDWQEVEIPEQFKEAK